MARLHEHEGKALFKIAKMPIPQGDVARTPEEARRIDDRVSRHGRRRHARGRRSEQAGVSGPGLCRVVDNPNEIPGKLKEFKGQGKLRVK